MAKNKPRFKQAKPPRKAALVKAAKRGVAKKEKPVPLPTVQSSDLRITIGLNNKQLAEHPTIAMHLKQMEDQLNAQPQTLVSLLALIGQVFMSNGAEVETKPAINLDASDLV